MAVIEPPSKVQLAALSTYERHQEKLPPFAALQFFDYYMLHCFTLLKKPINAFAYKEHNLAINFMEVMHLRDKVWELQLERSCLTRAYQQLGKQCDQPMEPSATEHTMTGQSEVFLATQEVKMFNSDMGKLVVYPDMLEEVRAFLGCEYADLGLFRQVIDISKRQLEDLLIMKH